jgi:hypothetical protein
VPKERKVVKYVSVRFPVDLLDEVRELAQEENRSINGEVVEAVKRYVRSRRRQPRDAQDGR